eukprot:g2058.t1
MNQPIKLSQPCEPETANGQESQSQVAATLFLSRARVVCAVWLPTNSGFADDRDGRPTDVRLGADPGRACSRLSHFATLDISRRLEHRRVSMVSPLSITPPSSPAILRFLLIFTSGLLKTKIVNFFRKN